MTVKELKEFYKGLYDGLNRRLELLEIAVSNHTGKHTWKDVVNYINSALLIVVIILLKFKVL